MVKTDGRPTIAWDPDLPYDAETQRIKRERATATFIATIEAAHEEHLQTGDYIRLGIATQDALLELQA